MHRHDDLVWLDSPGAIEHHLRRDIPPHDLEVPGVRFIVCDPDNQVVLHAQVGEPTTRTPTSRRVCPTMGLATDRTPQSPDSSRGWRGTALLTASWSR